MAANVKIKVNGYASRKFIVTVLGMTGGFVLAYTGKLDANMAMIVAAGIASYNWANVKHNNGASNE